MEIIQNQAPKDQKPEDNTEEPLMVQDENINPLKEKKTQEEAQQDVINQFGTVQSLEYSEDKKSELSS